MPAVTLTDVRKTYPGGVTALAGVSLTVADGELFALVGPSGSGKTTLLRILAGLDDSNSGTLAIGGRLVNDLPPHRRGVALVAQRPALYPHLTVADNLAAGRDLARPAWRRWLPGRRRDPETAARVAEAAGQLRLTNLLDRRPHQLSGGERQRVAIGRVLVRRPDVWLLDEPFDSLDSGLREELRAELHLLQRAIRATMIWVTHDPIEATALGERIGVLGDGQLWQVGPPAELLSRPGNRRVAHSLLRPPPVWVEGSVRPGPAGLTFVSSVGPVALPAPPAVPGRPLTLGVPAEALSPAPDGISFANATLVLAEWVGDRRLATLDSPVGRLRLWWPGGDVPAAGSGLHLTVRPERLLWFDGPSGAAVGP